jgi:hypothetical protein
MALSVMNFESATPELHVLTFQEPFILMYVHEIINPGMSSKRPGPIQHHTYNALGRGKRSRAPVPPFRNLTRG